jgi:hypothetical protein
MARRALLALLVLAGCNTDPVTFVARPPPGTGLDCEFLASDNCWKRAVEQASQCAAPVREIGSLDSPRRFCTFYDGQKVLFERPLPDPFPGPPGYEWKLLIEKEATECLRYEESEDEDGRSFRLTFPTGAVAFRRNGNRASVTCEDGAVFTTDDMNGLSSCPAMYNRIPGSHTAGTEVYTALTLLGAGEEDAPLFTCGRIR